MNSSTLRRWWPAVVGVLVLVAVFAVPLAGKDDPAPAAAQPAPSASASAAPVGIAPVAAGTAPAPGRAELVEGPFTDRLRLQRLALRAGTVTGAFSQVADNSAIIVMEVQADFFDARGSLLGSRRTVLRQPDVVAAGQGGTGSERYGGDVVFRVAPSAAWSARVSSAAVSVPTLVNE